MKRFLSVLMVFSLVLFAVPSNAMTIDYSIIKEYSDVLSFDIDSDGCAYISYAWDKPTFTHKNSPIGYNSLFYSDIIVVDYYNSPRAACRIWINYTAPKSLGITSATFHLNGTDYTFNIARDTSISRYDDFSSEEFGIVLGSENALFWLDLMLILFEVEDADELYDITIPVTLHGAIDDVSFNIPEDGIFNLLVMLGAINSMIGVDGMMENYGDTVTISEPTLNQSI